MKTIYLIIGLICGLLLKSELDKLTGPSTKQPAIAEATSIKPPEAKLEVSIGGEVSYYTVPLDHTIHVITDGDLNAAKIQLIPNITDLDKNGKQADKTIAGDVPKGGGS